MPGKRSHWVVIAVLTAIFGSAWIGLTRAQSDEINLTGIPPSPDIGHPAPDFTLVSTNGEEVSLKDFQGQPVLINFWATWCPPCRAEIPALEQVSREMNGEIVILGVDVQENPGRVAEFVSEYGITYPVVLDEDAVISRLYRVRAFPTSYLLDERGVVVEIYSGPVTEPLLLTRFAELVGN